MKNMSLIRDLRTSKDSANPARARSGLLAGKERKDGERGQNRTAWKDSFLHMWNVRWAHAAAGMTLGALAVGLGKEAENAPAFLIPVCMCLSILVAMGVWGARGARRGSRFGLASFASAGPAIGGAGQSEGEGAALLSHEMKNYLCTLKGNAHLLRQRVPSDGQAIIDRIDRVVEKLEGFTRLLGAGEAATSLGDLTPMHPAQAARACARTHFHKRIDAFRFHEDPSAPALLCDPGRLDQVFLNLYANAFEAGAVRIDTKIRREGGRLILRIEDDGRGCSEEDLPRIFEPFFTTKPGPVRRGLGMFIVQSIVENHGGSVLVATKNDSPEGRTGLIFTLDFPQPWRGEVSTRPAPLKAALASSDQVWMLDLPSPPP
jgi:signal transduction histidine kinase